MNCKKCGQMNPEGSKFCLVCGEPLEVQTNVVPATPTESILPGDVNQTPVAPEVAATPVVETPVAPVTPAPVAETPVAPAPVQTAPVTPEVTPAPVQAAPVAETPVQPAAPVAPEAPVMESISVTPNANVTAPAPEKKKSKLPIILAIVALAGILLILGIVVIVKFVISNAKVTVTAGGTTSVIAQKTTEEKTTEVTTQNVAANTNAIMHQGLSIVVPTGYVYKVEDGSLYIMNKSTRDMYQFYRFTGSGLTAEAAKYTLETFGYTDVTVSESTFMGFNSVVGSVNVNGTTLGVMYLDLKDGSILQMYMSTTSSYVYESDLKQMLANVSTSTGTFAANNGEETPQTKFKTVEITE